jgi:Poly(3-hydroxybutyrate) depolymerase
MILILSLVLAGCGSSGEKRTEQNTSNETETVNEDTSEQESVASSGAANKKLEVDELGDVTKVSDEEFSCTYEDVKHDFLVYLPEKSEGAPFVIMLHGYGESAEAFREKTHFEEDALKRGFAVIYVDGATDPGDKSSSTGWNSGISSTGNNDICFLVSLAEYLEKEYSFDETRAYVVGFSNGAFMTHRIAMEGQGTFAGVVSVAGKMPQSIWDERGDSSNISFFQVTGEKDDVVPKYSDNSAKYAKDPAIEDVIDYWVSSNGLELEGTEEIGKGSELAKYSAAGKNARVWNLFIKSARHSWPEESLTDININSLILDFLDQ